MANNSGDWPQEGELVVCVITNIKQNGAYASLDKYGGKEGFIFVGEIAAGWVKNIRSHVRQGQRLVAKVTRVKRDRQSVELSLKSVSEERRRDAMQAWKNENRARQLLKIVGERSGWSDAETATTQEELTIAFGELYAAFEESVIDNSAMSEAGFEGDWTKVFVELAIENIVPPFVQIRGYLEIVVTNEEGIEVIREALSSAEDAASAGEETVVTCHYDGAPRYRVEIQAPDYKAAENAWHAVETAVLPTIEGAGGSATAERA